MPVSKPDIQQVPAHPSNYSKGRQGYILECVVLHVMAGSLAGTDAWFQDPRARASTHFGVGKNGEIHQYVSLTDMAYANGQVEPGYTSTLVTENAGINPNYWCVSVEHEGQNLANDMTAAMFEASTRLSAWAWQEYIQPFSAQTGAKVDRDHFIGHYEISPQSRPNCPGMTEDQYRSYIARVQALLTDTILPVPIPPPDYKALFEREKQRADRAEAGYTDLERRFVILRDATTMAKVAADEASARAQLQRNSYDEALRKATT